MILLAPPIAIAQSISYELYELGSNGQRTLIAKGVKSYGPKDVIVERQLIGNAWSKEVPVANGFNAGGSIYRERVLTGFGLWLKKRDGFMGWLSQGGFSWDWFNQESGLVYRKLQGPGRVKVTLVQPAELQEIASIEFLEDVTLRAMVRPWWFFGDGDTHHLVIHKGSVFQFAP